ncbi:DUF2627 domain-containing protein [Paenibacillus daejeonensis]|uniref:DUF2627 domain-containing protein n=1 Tax=Paenibacillus daejeonensis TaxID=135193 RepID=UPI00037BFF99|nr:DUF2627 domain-containing protein [Paenibacillus daejeonensis]
MRLLISRFIAVLLLAIPGVAATYGFLAMKNAIFDYFSAFGNDLINPSFGWIRFIIGAILFLAGIAFIGGWIFFRDRKRNYLSSRFKPKRPRPPRPDQSS